MDNLLGSYIEHDFGIEIELTGEYPEALLKEDIISYFVWLNFDKKASTEWDSVYLRMFDRAMIDFPGQFERGFKEGIPLEAYPPLSTREHWRCRGLKLYNRILVLEILERRGIIAPYSRIVCHSPKFISVETDRKPVTPRGETEDTGDIPAFVLDETVKAADKGAEPRRISNPNTLFRFVNKPKVVKVRSKTQIRHKGESCDTGDNFRQPSEKTNRNDDTVSTRTRFPGGSIRSAEFVPLIDTATFPEGFSDFKKALDILQDKNWDWNVQVTFRNCETSSIIERDRVCAIVHISSGSIGSRFIFEFNRLEYSSSSTLIVIPSWGYADRYESVDKHLSIVVKNSFHWNIYRLRQNREFEYLLLRHVTGQTVEAWAERLIKKLIY
ncbi:MAG: hypothetical protein HPY53_00820 [Brevinematales bacterium]|nr:hypothetical protein [Brevinematales bacterium]